MGFPNFARGSLKTRITLVALIVFAISAWSMTYYASRMLREDMERQLGQQQLSTVTLLAAQVDRELAERITVLQAFAAQISPDLLGKPVALQHHLEQKPALPVLFNGGAFVTQADGTAVASIPRESGRVGTNFAEGTNAVVLALREGKTTVGTPRVGRVQKAPLFGIVTPIRDAQGRVLGALAGVTELGKPNFLTEIVTNRYGNSGHYLLVAMKEKLIVASSDSRGAMTPLPAPGTTPAIDRFLQGSEETAVYTNPQGVEVLASIKTIPAVGWYVGATLPTAEAFSPIHDMQRRLVLAAAVFTLLVGGIVWWMVAHMLRRQLSPMVAAAGMIDAQSRHDQPIQLIPIQTRDEIGELVASFNRLLSALSKQESSLRDSEARFRTLAALAPVGIYLTDAAGDCLYANARWLEMAGMDLQAALGQGWVQGLHPEDKASVFANWAQMVDSEGKWGMEYRFQTPDKRVTWVYGLATPQRDDAGKLAGYVGINLDITERKRLEHELLGELAKTRELNLKLEQAQNQLLQSEKMAAIGQLAAGVAHELNNPIGFVLSNLGALETYVDDLLKVIDHAEQCTASAGGAGGAGAEEFRRLCEQSDIGYIKTDIRQLLSESKDGANRVRSVVQNLKEFSHVGESEWKWADLHKGIDSTLTVVWNELKYKAEVCKEYGTLPEVYCLASQINQVIMNLLVNAAHAIETTGTITIRTGTLADTDDSAPGVWIEVADTGHGIGPENVGRIFEPFFTTKPVGKGTGLGLSLAWGIVQKHHGKLDVESEIGKGTVFRMTLPVKYEPPRESASATESSAMEDELAG